MRASSSGRISKEVFQQRMDRGFVLPCYSMQQMRARWGIKLFSWSRSHWRLTFSQSPGRTKLLLLATSETHAMRWNTGVDGTQHWGKADWCREIPFMQPLPLCGYLSDHVWYQLRHLFSLSERLLGWRKGQSAPLCRVWVFYSVAGPGFWPDYTSTFASVWCPLLCLSLLWLRHSQTIPRPGSTFGKLLEQSPPISLQSQTISITHNVPITKVSHQTTWIPSPWVLPFLPATETCP